MPDGILSDLMFNNTIEFNTSELSVFSNGKAINDTYYGSGHDIEFRDKDGILVYRMPNPVIYDTPEKVWNSVEGKWMKDESTIDYADCRYRLKPYDDGIEIRCYLPYGYLTRPTTRFPVYLDPSISPTYIDDSITYEGWFNNTIKRTDSSGTVYLDGTELWLDSSMTIDYGGTLTLNNVSLHVNCTLDGQYFIDVYYGGALNLVNGTLITNGTTDNYYCLNYWMGSAGVIDKSTVEKLDDCLNGLNIMSNIIIIDSTIRDSKSNALYISESNPTIINNTIYNPAISGEGAGIYVGFGSSPKIYRNDIYNYSHGIQWTGNYWEDPFGWTGEIEECLNTQLSGGRVIPSSTNSVEYSFIENDGGFKHSDNQFYSTVFWDQAMNNINFDADHRDPEGTHERLEKKLPYQLGNQQNWSINTTFSLLSRNIYVMGPVVDSPTVFPLYLESANESNSIYVYCYGGDAINNTFWDIIYIKTDNATIATYYSNNSGWGWSDPL